MTFPKLRALVTILLAIGALAASEGSAVAGWLRGFGTSVDENASPIRKTAGGSYVFGGTTGSPEGSAAALLFQIDGSGSLEWTKSWSVAGGSATSVMATADGGYLVSGSTPAGIFGESTFWLASLDAAGSIRWQRSYGVFLFALPLPLDAGGTLVLGTVVDMISFAQSLELLRLDGNGQILWQKVISSGVAGGTVFGMPIPLADGGFLLTGATAESYGDGDSWVARISSSGALLWQKRYGFAGADDALFAAVPLSGGGFLLEGFLSTDTGSGNSTDDAWFVRVDDQGSIVWQQRYGGPADETLVAFELADGSLLASGGTSSYGAGGMDALLMKLTGSGAISWAKSYGAAGDESLYATVDPTGGFLLEGDSDSFDGGKGDGWLAKVSSTGTMEWQRLFGGSGTESLGLGARSDSLPVEAPPLFSSWMAKGRPGFRSNGVLANELVAAGSTDSGGAGGTDVWAASLDSSGQVGGSCGFVRDAATQTGSPSVASSATTVTATTGSALFATGTRTVGSVALVPASLTLASSNLCSSTSSLAAAASANPTSGPPPLSVTFTGGASNGTSPYSWDWDFGDGTSHGTAQSPLHVYTSSGTFTAHLTVRDSAGATASASVTISVGATVCTVDCSATVPTTAAMGTAVSFGATATATACLIPPVYVWTFGDGSGAAVANTTHTYAAAGSYSWTLTVTAGTGFCTKSGSIVVTGPVGDYRGLLMVPGQARAFGSDSSFFRSSFWATNTGSTASQVRLDYIPRVGSNLGGAATTKEYSIDPGKSLAFRDVLSEAFGATTDTAGGILVEVRDGTPAPLVTSRTFNDDPVRGTYGQFIPAVPLAGAAGEQWIYGLGGDSANRSNVGVVNLSSVDLHATVEVYGPGGVKKGKTKQVVVPPSSSLQVNRVNTDVDIAAGEMALFGAKIVADGPFFTYASKLDNPTSDPIFVPGTLVGRLHQWIDGTASASGANNTYFRSNLSLTNPGSSTVTAKLSFTKRNETAEAGTATVPLGPRETKFWNDAVKELFGLEGVAGFIEIVTAQPIVAWGRTYNDNTVAGGTGSYGQFIPAFAETDLIGTKGAIFPGLSQNTTDSSGFRTNMGIQNVGSSSASVLLQVFLKDGTKAGEKSYTVEAGQAIFKSKILDDILGVGSGIKDGYVVVKPPTGARIYAWASSVDNRSSDPTFVRPMAIP
jgi:PKD repeat protein